MTPTVAHWVWLFVGIALEGCGTICLKLSEGLTKVGPSVLIFAFYGLSLACVAKAVRGIELGMAYAIWSGVGTTFITAVGIAWFAESLSGLKLACIGLIVVGVVGLKLLSAPS